MNKLNTHLIEVNSCLFSVNYPKIEEKIGVEKTLEPGSEKRKKRLEVQSGLSNLKVYIGWLVM